jgi:hypothetical protein
VLNTQLMRSETKQGKEKMQTNKEKAIIDMIIRWLNSNIDEAPPEGAQEDSANLKEKIELALDPNVTIQDIELGDI